MRAGLHLDGWNLRQHLHGLHDLTAAELVAIADLLGLAVDDLLIADDPAAGTGTSEQDPGVPSPAPEFGHVSWDTARAVLAALLTYGALTEATVMTALQLRANELDAVLELIGQMLRLGNVMTVRHAHGRLELITCDRTDLNRYTDRLCELMGQVRSLSADHTPLLLVAIRAHAVGAHAGPPLVPWSTAEPLIWRGAAQAPAHHETAGRPVRLIPHTDMLFALRLTDQPADQPAGTATVRQPPRPAGPEW
ncbi:hypothetical protein [Actinomadura montaniterrae]|uniref:Uncharacterized protein n=1 Tax=Actinomadura montaniterrae TaxID=1803903 RepID=A0A6L3VXH6_9ACTN|nr:hypothetical protein [Actinomadura montaniterrae]KAB2384857.1 hypothetical protein F9B16_09520 [Actinomadura montaniterrae]